jgi:hypothetical protein
VQLSLLRGVERSGFVNRYFPVLVAGVKAKTVTSNLHLLSVLATVLFIDLIFMNIWIDLVDSVSKLT